MDIVSRAQWDARKPKRRHTIETPTPKLYIHHLAVEWHGPAGVRSAQAFHMDTRGWSDIAYSFLVDDDGPVYEGRGVGVAGGHTEGQNTVSHAICAMGNFDDREPPDAMVWAIASLARHGREQGWWGDITGGHRNAPGASTACPGNHLQALIPTIRAMARIGAVDVEAAATEEDPMPATSDVVDEIEFGGGRVQLTFDGGTRFIDGATWPHEGPFSYPGLPEEARQGPSGFYVIKHNDRGGFDLVRRDGARYSFPVVS